MLFKMGSCCSHWAGGGRSMLDGYLVLSSRTVLQNCQIKCWAQILNRIKFLTLCLVLSSLTCVSKSSAAIRGQHFQLPQRHSRVTRYHENEQWKETEETFNSSQQQWCCKGDTVKNHNSYSLYRQSILICTWQPIVGNIGNKKKQGLRLTLARNVA